MKKILFTLAALAMIMVSCTQDNLEIEAQENRTFTVSAAMPEANDNAQTRVSLTPDAESGSYGLELKWENDDKLMLCFEKDGTYYHNDAPIVGSSISNNGKSAQFTITIPTEIPANETFNLYGVYQKTDTQVNNGGYFKDGSKLFELENGEEQCITLDKMGSSENGIARPMLYFSQANIENSSEPAIAPINLKHSGWMMALHFKNSSGVEMDMPERLILDNPQGTKWAWNGIPSNNTTIYFDVSTQAFSYESSTKERDRGLWFKINEYNWLPLYGQKLAAGKSIVFYRWVASHADVPQLIGKATFSGSIYPNTSTNISPKTVTNGKMYHVYSEWDGTDYKFVAAY